MMLGSYIYFTFASYSKIKKQIYKSSINFKKIQHNKHKTHTPLSNKTNVGMIFV